MDYGAVSTARADVYHVWVMWLTLQDTIDRPSGRLPCLGNVVNTPRYVSHIVTMDYGAVSTARADVYHSHSNNGLRSSIDRSSGRIPCLGNVVNTPRYVSHIVTMDYGAVSTGRADVYHVWVMWLTLQDTIDRSSGRIPCLGNVANTPRYVSHIVTMDYGAVSTARADVYHVWVMWLTLQDTPAAHRKLINGHSVESGKQQSSATTQQPEPSKIIIGRKRLHLVCVGGGYIDVPTCCDVYTSEPNFHAYSHIHFVTMTDF
ncbi:hypothetical protein J6590_018009 [Homalodisca vitripennis]|nr:hypothetical protein J6590_018009 [Homalodisca vitripennis]